MTTTLSRKVWLAASVAVLGLAVGCDEAVTPAPETSLPTAPAPVAAEPAPAVVQLPETDPVKATERRIADILALKAAIDAYYAENGKYPAAYDGLKGAIDRGVDWIPGLAPKYIAALPRDPLLSDSKDGPQYLFVSDTKGFKLIAVKGNVGACDASVEIDGIKIDPARQRSDVGCWAFGFWTDDFAGF
jgi:type II secretory pathway pseudopilin PulG